MHTVHRGAGQLTPQTSSFTSLCLPACLHPTSVVAPTQASLLVTSVDDICWRAQLVAFSPALSLSSSRELLPRPALDCHLPPASPATCLCLAAATSLSFMGFLDIYRLRLHNRFALLRLRQVVCVCVCVCDCVCLACNKCEYPLPCPPPLLRSEP